MWGSKTLGCAGELSRQFCDGSRTYKEKFWYSKGPFSLGANFAVGLKPFTWLKYDGCLQYTLNDKLSLWLTHEKEGDGCGL